MSLIFPLYCFLRTSHQYICVYCTQMRKIHIGNTYVYVPCLKRDNWYVCVCVCVSTQVDGCLRVLFFLSDFQHVRRVILWNTTWILHIRTLTRVWSGYYNAYCITKRRVFKKLEERTNSYKNNHTESYID